MIILRFCLPPKSIRGEGEGIKDFSLNLFPFLELKNASVLRADKNKFFLQLNKYMNWILFEINNQVRVIRDGQQLYKKC